MNDTANWIIKEIVKFIKNDDLFVVVDWWEGHHSGVTAWDFFNFAKKDFEENTDRGKVNCLSNTKRAIHLRVDEIIRVLEFWEFSKNNWGLPYKLEVLKSMNIVAPKILLDWINKRRNLLEHEYFIPDDVRNDLEVAELYLEATDKYVQNGHIRKIIISEKGSIADEIDQIPSPSFHTMLRYEYELDFPPVGQRSVSFKILSIPKGIDPISDRKKRLKQDIVDGDKSKFKMNEIDPNDFKEIIRYVWAKEF